MKAYTKLQILEAAQTVVTVFGAEDPAAVGDFADVADCLLLDIFAVLEGDPRFARPTQAIIAPEFGFVPVLGQIVADPELGNRVEWYRGDPASEEAGNA
ncbi:MAG: hypothetical protein FOGNACKC_01398 [Anaerolineae bacterium]|nr:hypothetical protein [Anaerolineae bacterium]